ncbi:MAG: P-loop NTPase fold protein [Leadbetterella sp.]|nr:P-loop NTPase fold protein [Leadbetterella sp.]
MKDIRYKKIEVDSENPFEDCKLDRKKYADNLTQIITNYPTGFVLALNNRWGDGKTFFIDRWKTQLKNQEFQTIYYNAWEDDYSGNALISILAELKEDIVALDKKLFDNVITKGTAFITGLTPKVMKLVAKKVVGEDGFDEIAEYVGEQFGKPLNKLIDDYTKQKQTVSEFKIALEAFASASGNGKPIVFFIDELDRCKPSYAVEVLEIIKHLFAVDNIVFVLGIDKNQLSNSIRGYYGSDKIDGNEYLKRFIDMEISLPKPKLNTFFEYIYKKLEFEKSLQGDRIRFTELQYDNQSFVTFSNIFFEEKDLNLRLIQRIMTQVRVVMYAFDSNQYMIPSVLLLLIYLKSELEIDYQMIKNKNFTLDEILALNKKLSAVRFNLNNGELPNIINLNEYYLYALYANYIGERLDYNGIKEPKEQFVAKYKTHSFDSGRLYELLTMSRREAREKEISLDYLFTKIELSQNLSFN